jgi:putative ABC transport system permease protein
MIKHFWLSAIRNLSRSKTFTFINLIGLSLSIATFVALLSFVAEQFSYDNFLTDRDRIYRVEYTEFQSGEPVLQTARTHSRAAFIIAEYLPEVERVARIYPERALVFNENTRITDQKVFFADSSFFQVFGFPLVSGSPSESLTAPNSMMVSETQAKNYFGDEDPLGKTLYFNEHLPFTITGVFKDIPRNSSLEFDFLISWSTITNYGWGSREGDFHFPSLFTFVKLNDKVRETDRVGKALAKMATDHITSLPDRHHTGEYSIRPYKELHLATTLTGEMQPGTSEALLFGLLSLGIFILVTAWINYVNLSIAKSISRANEIGVRKVFGANRLAISGQFVMEAMVLALITCVSGFVLYQIIANMFDMEVATGYKFWSLCFASIILGTLLAAVYPAHFMSRYKPVMILRNRLGSTKSNRNFLHRALLTFQVFLAVSIIGITMITSRQINYIRTFDIGFNASQTISLRGPASTNSDSLRQKRFLAFKDEVLQRHQFQAATASFNIPGEELRFHDEGIVAVGGKNDKKSAFWIGWIDDGYVKTFGLTLLGGRNFERDEKGNTCLINERGAIALGYTNPLDAIGTAIIDASNDKHFIIGVLKDFHHESIRKPLVPMLFFARHPYEFGYYTVRAEAGGDYIPVLQEVWRKHYPNDPFIHYFMDSFFARQYRQDEFFNRLLGFFSVISIAVACLGLFGMASLSMVKRLKEIGIRKVLGASLPGLLVMLSREYLLIILVAVGLALPVSAYFTDLWLENFTYKFQGGWAVWITPGLVVIAVTLLTVSLQSIRAALVNPVDVLKGE